jgi:hypothetical protein
LVIDAGEVHVMGVPEFLNSTTQSPPLRRYAETLVASETVWLHTDGKVPVAVTGAASAAFIPIGRKEKLKSAMLRRLRAILFTGPV